MLVFDCFPADKAKDLMMQSASKGTPTMKNSNQVPPSSKFAAVAVDSELAKTPELTNASGNAPFSSLIFHISFVLSSSSHNNLINFLLVKM